MWCVICDVGGWIGWWFCCVVFVDVVWCVCEVCVDWVDVGVVCVLVGDVCGWCVCFVVGVWFVCVICGCVCVMWWGGDCGGGCDLVCVLFVGGSVGVVVCGVCVMVWYGGCVVVWCGRIVDGWVECGVSNWCVGWYVGVWLLFGWVVCCCVCCCVDWILKLMFVVC